MTYDFVRNIRTSFKDFKGFRIVPYAHRIGVITGDGQRHVFLEETAFLKFAGDFIVEWISKDQQAIPNKRAT